MKSRIAVLAGVALVALSLGQIFAADAPDANKSDTGKSVVDKIKSILGAGDDKSKADAAKAKDAKTGGNTATPPSNTTTPATSSSTAQNTPAASDAKKTPDASKAESGKTQSQVNGAPVTQPSNQTPADQKKAGANTAGKSPEKGEKAAVVKEEKATAKDATAEKTQPKVVKHKGKKRWARHHRRHHYRHHRHHSKRWCKKHPRRCHKLKRCR